MGLYYLQSRYYDPDRCRFLNADAFISTGQGELGNNMYAYCNNNPIMGCDPCGTCVHNWKFYNCEECDAFWNGVASTVERAWNDVTAWCVDAYDTINSVNQQQAQLQTQITIQQNDMIADAAEATWDAYMWSYSQQQEAQLQQAIATRDFIADRFSTPEKAKNTINAIKYPLGVASLYLSNAGHIAALPTFGLSEATLGTAGFVTGVIVLGLEGIVMIIDWCNE